MGTLYRSRQSVRLERCRKVPALVFAAEGFIDFLELLVTHHGGQMNSIGEGGPVGLPATLVASNDNWLEGYEYTGDIDGMLSPNPTSCRGHSVASTSKSAPPPFAGRPADAVRQYRDGGVGLSSCVCRAVCADWYPHRCRARDGETGRRGDGETTLIHDSSSSSGAISRRLMGYWGDRQQGNLQNVPYPARTPCAPLLTAGIRHTIGSEAPASTRSARGLSGACMGWYRAWRNA